MNIIGLDLSLTSPGIVILDTTSYRIVNYTLGSTLVKHKEDANCFPLISNIYTNKQKTNLIKYNTIVETIKRLIVLNNVKYCAIEGYSYSSSGQSAYQLAELDGIVKYTIHHVLKKPLRIYEPSLVKMAISGKGNAKKEYVKTKIMEHFYQPTLDHFAKYKNAQYDLFDAFSIAYLLANEINVKTKSQKIEDTHEYIRKALYHKRPKDTTIIINQDFI